MKLISWNVNGLRACEKKGFKDFFLQESADVFAIQETKMQPSQLPESLHIEGYHEYMHSAERKGYSGTMVYTKQEPLQVIYDIEGDPSLEGRVISLEFENYWFVTAYVPNSKEGLARLDFRMEWEDALRKHLLKLEEHKPVIYTGDLNVAHQEIDLKNPATNHENPGFSDQERQKFQELLDAGYVDSFRMKYPDRIGYSWWSYRFKAREKNIGWRIDYFVVSKKLQAQIQDALIYADQMGSDHCPIGLEIDL